MGRQTFGEIGRFQRALEGGGRVCQGGSVGKLESCGHRLRAEARQRAGQLKGPVFEFKWRDNFFTSP